MMITGKKIRLRDKKIEDVANDYRWHRDAELAYLDATVPTSSTFSDYQQDYINSLQYYSCSRRRMFAIETTDGEHIGNCAYYDIDHDDQEAQLGIMIGERKYWSKGYGQDIINTLLYQIFNETRLKRIYLKTLESNQRAQHCFKKCGFTSYVCMVQHGYSFVFMEIYREDWLKQKQELPTSCQGGK